MTDTGLRGVEAERGDDSERAAGFWPSPAVYELEYQFWPWGLLIDRVIEWVTEHAGRGSTVVDYMCGTGYLLHQIRNRRPDLCVAGCSLESDFISYGHKRYPSVDLSWCDAFLYDPPSSPDIVICTAGIHHLRPAVQREFVAKIHGELGSGKIFLIGEEVLSSAVTEQDRRHSVIELWSNLLRYIVDHDGPDSMITAALSVLRADLLLQNEFKLTYNQLTQLVQPFFTVEAAQWLWPGEEAGFGDVLLVCRSR